MRWPWKHHGEPDDLDGQQARAEATAELAAAQSRWPEVNRVAQSLRELRERNHFADQIHLIFEGTRRDR